MASQFKCSSLIGFSRFCFFTLSILLSFSASSAAQQGNSQDSLRGSFQLEKSESSHPDKNGLVSPAVAFIDNDGGQKYSVIAQSFHGISPQMEYIVTGIVAQKHLPANPTAADYQQIVQSAWPYIDSAEWVNSAAKDVEAWIKKNPDKQLLLVGSLRKAASSQPDRKIIRVGGGVQESKLIKRILPVYPQTAKKDRISGVVILIVTIDEEGNVEDIAPTKGHPLLIPPAIEAVRQWKYTPTTIDGAPVPVIATVTVIFQMGSR